MLQHGGARTGLLVGLVFACLSGSPHLAQSPPAPRLAPGDYVTERGWGQLSLTEKSGGQLSFSIEAVGGNAHSCSVEGTLRNGRATLEGSDAATPCVVTMKAVKTGVAVTSTGCSFYCGMRAQFDGLYLTPPDGCTPVEIEAARADFKRQYDARAYARARQTLEPVLTTCGPLLDWLTAGWVRNDLAVTLHKLGALDTCRKVLEPLAEDAGSTDASIQERFPPTDAEMYLPIVRAARTNLALCRAR